MHKFTGNVKSRALSQFGFNKVLHRFDVVVGGCLGLFDLLSVFQAEACNNFI